jgi:magnesium transporter
MGLAKSRSSASSAAGFSLIEVLIATLILAVALLFNMLIAAVVGTLIPIALKTSRVDPAIASSVIITTFTDVFGFFSFLGLATLLIRFLL